MKGKAIDEQLRLYIEKSGLSTYRLSLESGVGASVISRFLNEGSDMQLSNASKIAVALNLELKPGKKA